MDIISKSQLQKEKITEQQLVNIFGTDAQKQSYQKNGRFIGGYKEKLLKIASRYCNVKDFGNRMYKITNVYAYSIPDSFNKMNKSLYQYMIPLLIDYFINEHEENQKIHITSGKLARRIGMVNRNYNLVKYNKENTSNETQYKVETINDFYDKADDTIERYITNTLEYMRKAGLITCNESYCMNLEISSGKNIIDRNGNVFVDVRIKTCEASEEDMDYYFNCVAIADKVANIKKASERYYSKKTKLFNETLKKELYKKKIKRVFRTYEICYTDIDKCKFIMGLFGKFDRERFIKKFNKEFTNLLVENAGKRFDKAPLKYTIYDDKEDYQLCFKELCDITINNKTEYLGYRIKAKKLEDDYNLCIVNQK